VADDDVPGSAALTRGRSEAIDVSIRRMVIAGLACALLPGAGATLSGQSATVRGLEVSVSGVARATNVSLTDCPPGANSVRGVIRPGDANEFISVTLDFKVLAAFKPGPMPSPMLADSAGKEYKTAQAFGEIGGTPSFSCTFSFRVPKGTTPARLTIDSTPVDLSKHTHP
jgi:hypothetical protein